MKTPQKEKQKEQLASDFLTAQVIKVRAFAECSLSKRFQAARLLRVATSGKIPGNSRSEKLKATLGDLEAALSSWDQIVPPTPEELAAENAAENAAGNAAENVFGAKVARGSGIPDEMKRRTRELLNQLKEQIEELSSEEKPAN